MWYEQFKEGRTRKYGSPGPAFTSPSRIRDNQHLTQNYVVYDDCMRIIIGLFRGLTS